MQIIQDLSLAELEEVCASFGQPKFRAKQIFENLHLGKTLNEISNIPKTLKEQLKTQYIDTPITIIETLTGKDGTQKFLYKLCDGNIIEGVLLLYEYGNTLCVSTQVGCRMGCKFCASTLNGLIRNLSAGEILSQVLVVNRMLGGDAKTRKITNIVLMGSGEPLDNYDNVLQFIHLVNAPEGINISQRNISLSTCGIVPKINKLAKEGLQIILTISLHAPTDEIRKQIMPIANKYSVADIVSSARKYFEATGRRVIFEYALTKGTNDTMQCAKILAKLLAGFPAHVNIIPLNEVKERDLPTVTRKHAYEFAQTLEKLGLSASVRRTMGEDIGGACGQLRASKIAENN
ncbi:MAG: 23S rRNA (adenine(2503)-C(2))-methyltransferase RlmN [Clostridia bacterium]|nr:23S rRNA (adenine(2503)-C(2))-methyltransferase RlmN [Clostridia bacterium]